MSARIYLIATAITLVVFVGIDFIWLMTMAERLYRPVIGDMLAPEFRPLPAIAFYLVYSAGLTFLAVRPGILSGSLRASIVPAAVLGFTAYATYDLTNQATLKNWSLALTLADLAWGTVLSVIAAAASHVATRKFAAPPST
jgi:uncharacterized membrane protein